MKPPISKPKLFRPSVDGTYAVDLILAVSCGHGFKLKGPIYENCTTSGNWQQINHEQDDQFYSSNYPRKCLPSNIDNIFLKLLIIREEFSYIFHYLIHKIHIIYLKNHVLVYCDSYPQPGNSGRLSIKMEFGELMEEVLTVWLLSHVVETSISQIRVTCLVTHPLPELSHPLVSRVKMERLHTGIME